MQNEKRNPPSIYRNVPREFGPPIRREAFKPAETFEEFIEALHQHTWAHATNNYGDFIQQTKEEDRLFSRAMSQSLRGLDAFRRAKEDSIRSLISTAVHQAINTERTKSQKALAKQKADYEAILTPEQKSLMAFRELLENHNWFYDYIDDGKTWRGHREHHKNLIRMARDGGKAFEEMYIAVYKEKVGTQANEKWVFDDHFQHYSRG